MEENLSKMNEIDKIASLAAEIEIGERDADSVIDTKEYTWYADKYLKPLYDELYLNFEKLAEKLIHTKEATENRYQIESSQID